MRRQLLPLVLLALASACGDGGPTEPAGPVPGVLKIALATPNADDGALLFTVSGGRVSTHLHERVSAGESASDSISASSTAIRSITLCNSRTFPGHA